MKKILLNLFILCALSLNAIAQDQESDFSANVNLDIVSGYVWRGVLFDPTPSFQPGANITYKGVTMGVWASSNFKGSYFEPDIYLAYSIAGLTLSVVDYHANAGADYFNFDSKTTAHTVELSALYTFGESLPLYLTASSLLYGFDKKIDSFDANGDPILNPDKNNYSSYLEAGYTFNTGPSTIDVYLGAILGESHFYNASKAGIINLGATWKKEMRVTDDFSFMMKGSLVTNPLNETAYIVVSLGL